MVVILFPNLKCFYRSETCNELHYYKLSEFENSRRIVVPTPSLLVTDILPS